MSKQITVECQCAINMIKATEMAIKNQLDLLEKTIQQKKSFRSLSLLTERTRANEKELKDMSQNVRKQQPHQNTAASILSRKTKLISRLNELQLQIDLLDDNGQLSQSSQRIRDEVSMISSKENRSHQSTPVSIDINEGSQLHCNLEQQKSSTAKPTNANSCPQPTKNQSSVVAENIQLQNPQYTYATYAERVTRQKKCCSPF